MASSRQLPAPRSDGPISLESALAARRSVRSFARAALRLDEVGQLLWAAQGVTGENGLRTSPSAGAQFPLEVYLIAGNVEGLDRGVYRYLPGKHALDVVVGGDKRRRLTSATYGQNWLTGAPALLLIAATDERMTESYGDRATRYIQIEAGHAAENVCLQAVALELGSVIVGAFDDARVRGLAMLPADRLPLLLVPVGRLTSRPSVPIGSTPA